jgi:DNA-binding HxlR family transcriptional regulator
MQEGTCMGIGNPMETKDRTARVYTVHCPARRTLELLSDKWTPLVLYVLTDGAHRFNELQRRCDGISRKMLTQTLRGLQRDGLVHRTDLGESLMAPLASLCAWGALHLPQIEAARSSADGADKRVLETVP